MTYTQKPEDFMHESEFRIVAINYEICPEACEFPGGEFKPKCDFMVTLGRPLDYLSLMYRK